MPNPGGVLFCPLMLQGERDGSRKGESETTFEHVILQGTRSCAGSGRGGDRVSRDVEKLVFQIGLLLPDGLGL